MRHHQGLTWPTRSDAERAALIWAWLQTVPDGDRAIMGVAHTFSSHQNMNDASRDLAEQVITPLFDYLNEAVATQGNIMYLLERYVRKFEWFDRDALHEAYTANTQQGEAVYDRHLRKFLFDQGIDMPFSQLKSASGLSDVIGELDSDDPLVAEVKLFDAGSYGKRSIASGVQQVLQYALEYHKQVGYVVIIDLSGRPLTLPTEDPSKSWPPYVEISGVRVYLIAVHALALVSASKLGKARPSVVTLADLTDPDANHR